VAQARSAVRSLANPRPALARTGEPPVPRKRRRAGCVTWLLLDQFLVLSGRLDLLRRILHNVSATRPLNPVLIGIVKNDGQLPAEVVPRGRRWGSPLE